MYRDDTLRKSFWARGNGWVIAGAVRVLQYLPSDDPARRFRQVADDDVEFPILERERCAVDEMEVVDTGYGAVVLDINGMDFD